MITMIVSSVPAAPTSFCSTAHTKAVTAMISEAIGQTIQKLLAGYPPSHRPTIRPATVNERVRPVPQARPPDGAAVTLGWFRGAGSRAGRPAGAQDRGLERVWRTRSRLAAWGLPVCGSLIPLR